MPRLSGKASGTVADEGDEEEGKGVGEGGSIIVETDGREVEYCYEERECRVKTGDEAVNEAGEEAKNRVDDEEQDDKIAGVSPEEGEAVEGCSADGQIGKHLFECGEKCHWFRFW